MKIILLINICLLSFIHLNYCAPIINLVEIACKRNIKSKLCHKSESTSTPTTTVSEHLPNSPKIIHNEKVPLSRAEFQKFKQLAEQTKRVNGFKNDVRLDQDIINFDSEEDDDKGHFIKAPTGSKTRVENYCDKYQENYAYYCGDSIDKTPSLHDHLSKFCPSYESNCPGRTLSSPRNPFSTSSGLSAPVSQPTSDFPDLNNPVKEAEDVAVDHELEELKRIRPCKPECDQRIHKHCTPECKCDYLYPYVQRFCNPPPIPLFLNTCRIWYTTCPKYRAYHYSSQYVYSKAEKGKTVGGLAAPARGTPGNPYLVGNHEVPTAAAAVAKGELTSAVSPQKAKQLVNQPKNVNDPFETAREQFFTENNIKPKARQAAIAPATADDGNFHNFDSFSDSRGVAYRTRSRSPFSKPGLWEPNPDDPHNRDHANKWWYYPDSVGVDWLSGQLQWGKHWAVPAAGTGGTDGFSSLHFPSIGNFLNIADDYD